MEKIGKILVAVDFSECSERALDTAAELASAWKAQLDLIHVWEVPTYLGPDAIVGYPTAAIPLSRFMGEESLRLMHGFTEEAKKRGIAIHETFVVEGNIANTICEKAAAGAYDLIALGTRGRTGLGHLLLGSVAESVVRHATVPVLTVRTPKQKT
jgi:universal stress protein A